MPAMILTAPPHASQIEISILAKRKPRGTHTLSLGQFDTGLALVVESGRVQNTRTCSNGDTLTDHLTRIDHLNASRPRPDAIVGIDCHFNLATRKKVAKLEGNLRPVSDSRSQ
jgi:hypothetical protein